MANAYQGEPDARQQADTAAPVTRFRPRYRALTDAELALHDEIKRQADAMASLFGQIKPGREVSLGMTRLEEAVMWAVKGLAGDGLKSP